MENLHYRVSFQLHRADHTMGLAFDAALRPLDVTSSQVDIMLHIDRYPGVTMARLASLLSVTPQTMQRIVTGLEQRGFVERERRAGNNKSYYLLLTPSGADTLHRAEAVLKTEQDILKKHFTPQELKSLFDLLQRFEAVLAKGKKE